MKLSLVVPCYNEEGSVEKFFSETNRVFANNVDDYEFVFVDDGSTDSTYSKLESIYNSNPQSDIQVLSFSRNFGKEAALFAGINNAKGDWVCLIDADLQQRPEVVLQMLDVVKLNPSVDCVTAYQEVRNEGKMMTACKSLFYKTINKLSDTEFVNGASDFRLMNRKMADAIKQVGEYHRFSKGIFGYVGFNTEYIPYTVAERESGETKWGLKKLAKYAFDGILSFSAFPLKISTYVGSVASVISVIYIIIVLIEKLFFGIPTPGYATVVILILFLGGVQLFCLGMIGEYLSKIYIQVKNRPIYILKKHLKKDKKDD